ncbi:hypothetical protein [Egbenema bharatensis]|uniref:hypothetical protein n=1 Tax=Egbenema bharatensis TaxID=3463334 RepID=UPI003A8C278E
MLNVTKLSDPHHIELRRDRVFPPERRLRSSPTSDRILFDQILFDQILFDQILFCKIQPIASLLGSSTTRFFPADYRQS